MSPTTTAAVYGALSGAVVTGIINILLIFINRQLRRRGGIEFTPSNWRFAYLAYPLFERSHVDPQGEGEIAQRAYYRLSEPSASNRLDPKEENYAVYAFTADILNKMDLAETLRGVSIAFMKDEAKVFEHRPFDEENTTDRTPVVFELPETKINYLPAEYYPPGHGVESIGTISIPAHDSKRIKLKGYISGAGVHYLHGGCEEVRLQATRENGKLFDEHIAKINTNPQARPAESGGESVGMLGS